MQIIVDKTDGNAVFSIKGRMDAISAPEFDKTFTKQMEEGTQNFIMDLGNLEYISSAGLRSVLAALKKTKVQNKKLLFCNIKGSIKEIFDISGFTALFTIHASLEEAQKNLQS